MNKVKVRFITIISLFVMLAVALGVAVGLLSPATAFAADKTYSPSSIFWARTGGEVKAYKATAAAEEAYLTLVLSDGGSVEYHRDLALKWFVAKDAEEPGTSSGEGEGETSSDEGFEKPAEGALVNPGTEVYYSMTLAFPNISFKKFTITYQSAEENVSKKEQAVNKLVFLYEGDKLYAYVVDASHAEDEDDSSESERVELVDKAADQKIAFSETETAGDFEVKIGETAVGTFTNIGGYFMEYRTSGTANTPMTFEVEFPEGATSPSQKVAVKQLNGQSLKVTGGEDKKNNGQLAPDADGTLEVIGGSVIDDTPAVLVMSEKLYAFTLGQRFSLSYEAIDVCDDSVSVSRDYYMLKKETVGEEGAEQTLYHAPNESPDAKNEDYKTLTTSTYFMPPNDDNEEEIEYVSIRMILDDGRDGASKEFIYLSWYADLDSNVVIPKGDEGEKNWFDYIKVDRDKKGPHYTIITTDGVNDKTGEYDSVVGTYQQALNETAAKLSAGTGAYFYFPSMRELIESDYADYRNLRFNVYYYEPGKTVGSTAATATSMRYNNLRIEIKKPGTYKFRITASDAAGNNMQMYVDGKLTDVTSSNIWDIEEIPDFTFKVGYKGATVEDAGEQTQGYRGSVYNVSDFDVIALDECEKEYTLYYFNRDEIPEGGSRPSYSDFVKNADDYMATYLADENYKKVLVPIKEFNADVEEEDWEAVYPDNLYHWDPDSSLSFVPQESGYYVVRLHLTDPNMGGAETDAYQIIDVRNPVDYIPGTTNWFQNNVTSVILFAISGVLAVIIVVLFVVKPSDKTVEEVDLDELKGKNKKNNK